jgi:hypothetical protein
MTPDQLRTHAHAVIVAGGQGLTLTVPAGWKRPAGFPRCELLSINPKGERNVRVPANRLLRWLDQNQT